MVKVAHNQGDGLTCDLVAMAADDAGLLLPQLFQNVRLLLQLWQDARQSCSCGLVPCRQPCALSIHTIKQMDVTMSWLTAEEH